MTYWYLSFFICYLSPAISSSPPERRPAERPGRVGGERRGGRTLGQEPLALAGDARETADEDRLRRQDGEDRPADRRRPRAHPDHQRREDQHQPDKAHTGTAVAHRGPLRRSTD